MEGGDEGESNGGRGSSGVASQRQLNHAQLRRNSGDAPVALAEIGEGEGVEEDQRGEGSVVLCSEMRGRGGFYSLIVEAERVTGSIMEVAIGAAKGQGARSSVLCTSWRSSGR